MSEKRDLERLQTTVTSSEVAVIAAVSVILISLFSKSSFLYPLNDWVDANCFLTVGKSIVVGKVPYLDLYEQKGPLLYFLYALAAMVSRTTFFGVYLLEIVSCFVFLLFSYQTVRLYVGRESLKWLVLMSVFAYTARGFFHGGSAEELGLPYMALSLYLFFRSLHTRELNLSKTEGYVIGLCMGVLFWIKFTFLGLYLALAAVALFFDLHHHRLASLLRLIGMVFLGFATVSAPILLYFWKHQALTNLYEAYFFNNIFGYGFVKNSNVIQNFLHSLPSGVFNNICSSACIAVGIISLWRIRRRESIVLCVSVLFVLFFALCSGENRVYYSFLIQVFLPFGAIALTRVWVRFFSRRKLVGVPACVLCCSLTALLSVTHLNAYLFMQSRAELPQYRFREVICKEEKPTLLNYGFLDGGFYTVCDIVPTEKYFCSLNIRLDEMDSQMEDAIQNGRIQFVVTRDQELKSKRYRLVDTASYVYEHQDRVYRLYERIDE